VFLKIKNQIKFIMTFCLKSTIIKPEKGTNINNIIVLLHGYGGDGKDISMLTLNWKRHMPNTIFICPNAHEPCAINPSGYQWFDLTKDNPDYVLEETLKAEKKLNRFLNEVKNEYNLDNDKICLSGFSQGCMMSINIGLTSKQQFNCIVGFSGKIINLQDLKIRKKNSTDILLVHGDQDDIVPPTHLLEAKDFFLRESFNVETHLIKNCGHHIPIEASSIALNYILKKLNN
jgi:phospholipase/carboxylesterase